MTSGQRATRQAWATHTQTLQQHLPRTKHRLAVRRLWRREER